MKMKRNPTGGTATFLFSGSPAQPTYSGHGRQTGSSEHCSLAEAARLLAPLLLCLLLAVFSTACSGNTDADFKAEGRKLMQEGNPQGAVVFFKNALEKSPDDFDARFALAGAYLKLGKVDQAETELQKCLRLAPENAELHMELARLSMLTQKPAAVLEHVAKAEAKAGPSAESRELAGMANALSNESSSLDKGEKALEESLALEPGRASAWIGLARISLARRDPDKALERADKALAANPHNPAALAFRADLAMRVNDYSKALDCYRALAALQPNDEAARYMTAQILMSQGRMEEAAKERRAMRERFGDSAMVLMLDGVDAYESGKFNEAITAFQASLAKMPSLDGRYRLGLALIRTGNLESAVTQFRGVLDFAPNHSPALQQMCRVLLAQGRLDDAELEAGRLISLYPNGASGHFLMGLIKNAKGDKQAALASFQKASSLDPKMSEAALQQGSILLSEGRYLEARESLAKAVAEDAGNIDARISLFSFHLGRKDYAEAEKVLNEGLAADKDNVRLLTLLATLNAMREQRAEALAVLEKTRGLDPDYVPALQLEARLRILAGELDAASALYDAYLKRHPDDIGQLIASASLLDMSGKHEEARQRLRAAQALGSREALFILARREAAAKRPEAAEALLAEALSKGQPPEDDSAIRATLAQIYLQMQTAEKALALYDAVAVARPGEAALGKFRIHMAQGNYEKALEQARVLAGREEKSVLGAVCAADALERLGRPQEAMEELEAAYRKTQEPALLVTMGQSCLRRNETDKAEAYFRTALQRNPDNPDALSGQAFILLKHARYGEAAASYERALRGDPKNVAMLNNLAMAYAESGKEPERALRAATMAFMLQPDNIQVLDTMGLCLLQAKQTNEAVRMLKASVDLYPDSALLRYRFGLALLQAERKSEAAVELKKALELGPFEDSQKAGETLRRLEQ